MFNHIKKIINGDHKFIAKYRRIAARVATYGDYYQRMDDAELQTQTKLFKNRITAGESLEKILPEAFAVVCEAASRVLGMRPFPVQIIGGIVLHYGDIAEMKTGEGKTLTATMPVYLNALTGQGVHVITVNEYLSKRDFLEIGPLYQWLGLTTGLNTSTSQLPEKQAAYQADVTFTTDSELGFDYLKDNMVWHAKDQMQRGLNFALLDEVDSILIDESKSPLVIADAIAANSTLYERADWFVKGLVADDYEIDLESRVVSLEKSGILKAQTYFGIIDLYDISHAIIVHHIAQALSANFLYLRDQDYVVLNEDIQIVDQFTGRVMANRSFSDGLHQALECKERLPIKGESNVFASTTYQSLFRGYRKLAGMTGTAKTDSKELLEMYNMRVIAVPTNRPSQRTDLNDMFFTTVELKNKAIIERIQQIHETGQPILVGTASIEISEKLSEMLSMVGIPHNVLNAKNDAYEAAIIQGAGQKNSVTIATNMAGRGTDIKLGPEVANLGGLFVLGTERHESRRIDNQLRGRSGRQGDPGTSQFYSALQDDVVKNNATEQLQAILETLAEKPDWPISKSYIEKHIELCQLSAEGGSYDFRRLSLQYDDILNSQRELIYKQRQMVVAESTDLAWVLKPIFERTVHRIVTKNTKSRNRRKWDYEAILKFCRNNITRTGRITIEDIERKNRKQIEQFILDYASHLFEAKVERLAVKEQSLEFEKTCLITAVDNNWQAHMNLLSELREHIKLRGYAQQNPLVVYQFITFDMFEELINNIETDATRLFFKSVVRSEKL